MIVLSTGANSTLGEYLKLCKAFFGEDSKATAFIQRKIDGSLLGEAEEVIQSESQMTHLLGMLACEDEVST